MVCSNHNTCACYDHSLSSACWSNIEHQGISLLWFRLSITHTSTTGQLIRVQFSVLTRLASTTTIYSHEGNARTTRSTLVTPSPLSCASLLSISQWLTAWSVSFSCNQSDLVKQHPSSSGRSVQNQSWTSKLEWLQEAHWPLTIEQSNVDCHRMVALLHWPGHNHILSIAPLVSSRIAPSTPLQRDCIVLVPGWSVGRGCPSARPSIDQRVKVKWWSSSSSS